MQNHVDLMSASSSDVHAGLQETVHYCDKQLWTTEDTGGLLDQRDHAVPTVIYLDLSLMLHNKYVF